MITTETVLILGAGASADYGFPVGRQLLDAVCQNQTYQALEPLEYDYVQAKAFIEALKTSAYSSVDAFLEKFPTFLEIGKAAIAAALEDRHCPDNADLGLRHLG